MVPVDTRITRTRIGFRLWVPCLAAFPCFIAVFASEYRVYAFCVPRLGLFLYRFFFSAIVVDFILYVVRSVNKRFRRARSSSSSSGQYKLSIVTSAVYA